MGSSALGCALAGCGVLYGILQIYARWVGLSYQFGPGWAMAAIALLLLRFSLPITFGAFLAEWKVWDWPLISAIVFALPGLAFLALMVPAVLAGALRSVRRR